MAGPRWRIHDLRVVALGVVVLLAWAAIGYRLFQVQGEDAAALSQRGVDQRLRHEEISPKRGTIFDRDGVELAVTVYGSSLIADPMLVRDPALAAALLAPLVEENLADLTIKLDGDSRYVRLTGGLEHNEAELLTAAIEEAGLDGLSLVEEPVRIYPSGPLAAPVVGLTRLDDGSGIEGIEAIMDGALSGRAGERIVERDGAGRAIPQGEFLIEPATPGSDVFLTIDREIQHTAERVLGAAIEQTGSASGAVVVLEPSTGRILAMASLPAFTRFGRNRPPRPPVRQGLRQPGTGLLPIEAASAGHRGLRRSYPPRAPACRGLHQPGRDLPGVGAKGESHRRLG